MASKIIRKAFNTKNAPSAIGPYSQGVRSGHHLFISGQLGMDPKSMQLVEGGVEAQTHRAIQNIKAIVEEAGSTMGHVVKTTVLLVDMNDFVKVNDIYTQYFKTPFPARAAYQVAALPKGGLVEMEAIAIIGEVEEC